MDRLEYQTLKYDTTGALGGKVDTARFDYQLNKLGADGWELVSCVSTNQGYGHTRSIICVFKRIAAQPH